MTMRTISNWALALAALGLAACNSGDVQVPAPPGSAPPAACAPVTNSVQSPDGSRTCTWSLAEGTSGQQSDVDCGDSDCPATFVCSGGTGGNAGQWLPVERTCPNPSNLVLPPAAGAAQLYVALNGTANAGRVLRFDSTAESNFSLDENYALESTENQGIAVDTAGNLIHAGDGVATVQDSMGGDLDVPGFVTVCSVANRGAASTLMGNMPADSTDRTVRGEFNAMGTPPGVDNNPALEAPKGVTYIDSAGLIVIADFGAGILRIWGASAQGNVEAIRAVNPSAAPWDSAYDNANDVLYVALTNGNIAALDGFVAKVRGGTQPSVDRLINIVDGAGADASVNLHGIDYDPFSDTLIASDVGDAAVSDDGQVFFLAEASARNINGNVMFSQRIGPTNSMLGNPVDLVINGRDIVIAEKANDQVLVFRSVFSGVMETAAPDLAIAVNKPESVAVAPMLNRPSLTDLSDPSQMLVGVLGSGQGDNAVTTASFSESLVPSSTFALSGAGTQNLVAGGVMLSINGEGVFAFSEDAAAPLQGPFGGFASVNDLFERTDQTPFDVSRDSQFIDGPPGGGDIPTAPRGVEVIDSLGIALIANDDDLVGVSLCGNGTPLFTQEIDRTAAGAGDRDENPWDADLDETSGDLFVAMQNSNFAVVRNYLGNIGTDQALSVVVEPQRVNAAGQVVSAGTSLRGVEYVAGADTVIVSDVGATTGPGDMQDGQILIMRGAGQLSSSKLVDIIIAGDATVLRDPVDLGFDGSNLYVADAAGAILRFDNVLSLTANSPGCTDGVCNIAPATAAPLEGAQTVTPVPDYVGTAAVVRP